jgi:hypothetical protein
MNGSVSGSPAKAVSAVSFRALIIYASHTSSSLGKFRQVAVLSRSEFSHYEGGELDWKIAKILLAVSVGQDRVSCLQLGMMMALRIPSIPYR